MAMMSTLRYPDVERKEHQDTYTSEKQGSVVVSDHYHWLEGKGPEVDAFVQQQVDLTSTFIKAIPERNNLEDLIRKSSNYPKFSAPTFCRDGRYYWNYNSGLQAQYVLFRSLDDRLPDFSDNKDLPAGEVFFDPNLLAKDGTAALATSAFSKTGKYFAYGISLSGSDFCTIYVRETLVPFPSPKISGQTRDGGAGRMDDEIKYVKFSSIVWSPDDAGFFYQRYPARASHAEAVDAAGTEIEEDKFAKLYYHQLGTSQDDDILVMKDDDHPSYMWGAQVTSPDGRYLILYVSRDTARQNLLWITDLEDPANSIGPNMKWIKLINEWDASYSVLANDGPRFYIKTNKDAPNYRVMTIDISNEERVKSLSFTPFIDEDPKAPIEQIKAINQDTWAVVYSRDVKDELYLFNKAGKQIKRLAPDHIGVLSISGRRDFHRLFVTASGFTNPGVVYCYDFTHKTEYPHEPGFVSVTHTDGMQTPMPRPDAETVDALGDKFLGTVLDSDKAQEGEWKMWQATKLNGLSLDEFKAEQVKYKSKDGTIVPMFIQNLLWITDLEDQANPIGPKMKWIKLINEWDASYSVLANDGPRFYIKTNKNAPNYRVMTIDISNEERVKSLSFTPFIDEDPKAPIEQIRAINQDTWAVVYSRDVKDELYLFNKEGKRVKRLASDHIGVLSISGRRDFHRLFVTASGFTNPGVVYHYDFTHKTEYPYEPGFVAVTHTDGMQTPMPRPEAETVDALGDKLLETVLDTDKAQDGEWKMWQATKLNGLSLDEFKAEQVKYKSKDGTTVPMFIVSHKDAKRDGTAPAIQYGYGGFSISISPFFSASMLTAIKAFGGILAVPNIRGGAEYGETWHLAGTRENKPNVFDDFIAATQYLVDNKYAGPGKVIINGGSNGGLLVAACVNRAPEHTFGAAIAEVGVLDYLRFPLFTIGKAWTSDYGDPSNPEDFDFMYPISPYHNVDKGSKVLPPMLLLTADHDDRVVPLHSFKHIAEIQYQKPTNPHPLLIRIDVKSGHGAGKSTEKRIIEAADKWSFAAHTMGLKMRHVDST
ncbi:unnamed protein product [Rhizoctonia solani]|uniref:prolyl oligopeptidase n=1 Tax=Rhizoctonia solani TaxID=456999 RepID=A0A8H2Y0P2_9AGAM|nr:unnamed protein product [Rhizoctonia solani]